MAKAVLCDICGKVCNEYSRYEMVYKGVIRTETYDICYDCYNKFKQEIKNSKSQSKENIV